MSSKLPEITVLNAMLGKDFDVALERHQKLGLRWLDLKDGIYGKNFIDLTEDEAVSVRTMITKRNLEVYALSSSLCHQNVEDGETSFRHAVENEMKRVLASAAVFQPKAIRLLAAWCSRRMEFADSITHLDRHHSWIYEIYRECIERLSGAGYTVFLENEADKNILSTVAEIRGFFARVDCGGKVRFTWDIQNLWQMGTFPTVAVYESLRDLIGYLHFKGGEAGEDGKLTWASSLEEAAWPVVEIVRRAIADEVSPFFCLNPSHGKQHPGYDAYAVTTRDILFLQQLINSTEKPKSS
jgi:hypothetical protein